MNDKQGEDWHMSTGERGLRCFWFLVIVIVSVIVAAIAFYIIWQNVMRQMAAG